MSDQVRPVPVAVVGAGHLGSIHARVLSEMNGAQLLSVVDVDEKRARASAEPHGAFAGTSLADLPGEVEAAVVATPTALHEEVAVELLERGIAVLVEKPIAPTLEAGQRMVDAAAASGVNLMVGHSERFNPVIRALGALEFTPRFIDSQRVSPFSFRSSDIGVVLDMMIHDIDIILHLVQSDVKAVHAVGVGVMGPKEDLANARLLFENGTVANATASRVALKTERVIRIFSEDAYVTLDYHKRVGRVIRRGPGLPSDGIDLSSAAFQDIQNPLELMQKDLVRVEELEVDDVEPLNAEDTAFLDSVRNGIAPPVTGEDGLAALQCAQQIVASLQESLRPSTS